jgi:hypothetical protein
MRGVGYKRPRTRGTTRSDTNTGNSEVVESVPTSGSVRGRQTTTRRLSSTQSDASSRWPQANPSNWSAAKLITALNSFGLIIPGNTPKSLLLKLYLSNFAPMADDTVRARVTQSRITTNEVNSPTPTAASSNINELDPTNVQTVGGSNTINVPENLDRIATLVQEREGQQRERVENIRHLSPATLQPETPFLGQQLGQANSNNNNMRAQPSSLPETETAPNNNFGVQMQLMQSSLGMLANTLAAFSTNINPTVRSTSVVEPAYTLQQVMTAQSSHSAAAPALGQYSGHGPFGIPADKLPRREIVTPSLKKAIIDGKDVNLNTLLMPSYEYGEVRSVEIGDQSFHLKRNDHRLNKSLTLGEFTTAFAKYRNIMCEEFPQRRHELDLYQQLIVELYTTYPGPAAYEYHKEYSAFAATNLQAGLKVDWSEKWTAIYSKTTSGRRVQTCDLCGSMRHFTDYCQGNADKPGKMAASRSYSGVASPYSDGHGRPRVYHNSREICNNFNETSCFRPNCKYEHVCSTCKGSHPVPQCTQRKGSKGGKPTAEKSNTTNAKQRTG